MKFHCLAILLASVLFGLLSDRLLSAAEPLETFAFRRWAILGAPEVRESGVSDLLTAQLTAAKLELVEREQLDAVTREIELSKLLGADAAAQRLKIGQLTKADALILLSLVEHDKKKFVKLVISDCRFGSRLKLEHFSFANDRADKLANEIAQAAAETQTKFARGVERIVAVSPFLSKNLTHEFDHLQFGFAALLGQRLSERPGVAVLEIEEARAIGAELGRAGSQLDQRLVPVVIDSEFEVMERDTAKEARAVRFGVRLHGGKVNKPVIEHMAESLANASRWLIESLPNEIANQRTLAKSSALTPAEQSTALTRRADQFTQIAAYQQAIALREAALLLDETNWEQRVLLIGDLNRRIHQLNAGDQTQQSNQLRNDKEFRRRFTAEVHSLISGMESHSEQVLGAGVLNLSEATEILRGIVPQAARYAGDEELKLGRRGSFRAFYWRCLERCPRLDHRIRNGGNHPVFALAFANVRANEPMPLTRQHDAFARQAIGALTGSLSLIYAGTAGARPDDTETIRDLARLFDDILLPESFSPAVVQLMARNFPGSFPSLVTSHRISSAALIALFERWRDRRDTLLEFYGRAGLLALKSSGAIAEVVTEKDLAEADWLEAFLANRPKKFPAEYSLSPLGKMYLSEIRQQLTQALAKGTSRKANRLVELRLAGKDPFPRVAFEPVDVTANWTMLGPCGPGRDLVWSWDSIGVLTAPGKLKIIAKAEHDPQKHLLKEQDSFCSVGWDGEFIWAAGSQSGVRIFNLDGDCLGQFLPSSEGADSPADPANRLPPIEAFTMNGARGVIAAPSANRAFWLYPLDRGRCFIGGRFGKDLRRWFGVIERQASKEATPTWKFTRWHQMTKQASSNSAEDDLDVIYAPSYLLDFVDPADQKRWLLLGREGAVPKRPLGLLVATGLPALFPRELPIPERRIFGRMLSVNESLLSHDRQGHLVRWECHDPNKKPTVHTLLARKEILRQPSDPIVRYRFEPQRDLLLPVGDWVYLPGLTWRRIHTRNWNVEQLTDSPVSLRYDFENYAVSAHYGLVAWNYGDSLCRVRIDVSADEPRPLSWLYPFIPAELRERHHRAIESIRQLGGQVDVVPYDRMTFGREASPWRTVVWLTDAWQGGDDSLRYLADLYNVRDLFLERAPITDDGLKAISQLKTLQVVHVTETNASSAGVQSLAVLPELCHLWLENSAGKTQIGDDALGAFQGKPKLFQLTLSGPGFTDKSLSHVLDMPRVFDLRLIETDTTPAAIASTKQKRPGLRFLSETNQ